MNYYKGVDEQVITTAVSALQDADSMGLIAEVLMYLSPATKEELFKHYVHVDKYNCLKDKYDLIKTSHKLLHSNVVEKFSCS